MIPGGLEPPTSVLQTYALPAATASKCISLVDEMLSYRLLFENFGSFIACDKYFLSQKEPEAGFASGSGVCLFILFTFVYLNISATADRPVMQGILRYC